MGARSDDARQRRANENRASRQALAARKEAAARKAGGSRPVEPEASSVRGRGRRMTRAQRTPVMAPSGAAPPDSATTLADTEPPARGILSRTRQLPGGRSVLAGFVLALAGSAALLFVPIATKSKSDHHLQSLLQVAGLQAVPFAAIPAFIAAVPLLFMNHRWRRPAWTGAAFMLGLWVLLMQGLGIFHVLAAGSTVFGVIKASRADGRPTPLFGRRRLASARSGDRADADTDAGG